MDSEIVDYLKILIAEDADKNRDHIAWLGSPEAVDEEDRELQISQCERAVELAEQAQRLFPTD